MDRWIGKVAIVTGASAGIGAVIAKSLVLKGVKVVGLARRSEKIEELADSLSQAPGKLYALKCDITKEKEILKAFKWIGECVGPVHILINNAGLTVPTNLIDGSTEKWQSVFDVNVMGLCMCTREAVKVMKQHHIEGHIIHINSIVGHYIPSFPKPFFNVYPASKHAVTALTECLRHELRYNELNIKVTSVSPGLSRTEFENGITDMEIRDLFAKVPALEAQDIAEAVLYTLSTGPKVQVHEITIHALGEAF